MREWPPFLGFRNYAADITEVVWKDGTAVSGGILGTSEQLAAALAEQARKEELRAQPNVVLLSDYK